MKNLLMQDMKQTIRFFFMLMALMMGATSESWAQEPELTESDIVIDDGIKHGTVAFKSLTDRTVTLTITPDAGYYIKASDIVVEKLVKPGKANAPERRTPAFADVITGTMYSGSGRTEADIISSVKHPNSAEYEFTIPADYDGAYVTATFKSLTEGDIIRITASSDLGTTPSMTANYVLVEDVSATVVNALYSAGIFTGTFEGEAQADGSFPTISGLTHALFQTINGGTVKNIMFDNVNISGGTNVGTVCNEAIGDTRIYNCGVLATGSTANTDEDGYTYLTACSSTVSGSNYVGSIVGLLDETSRVINCFSYANVSGGTVGGIVGYNNVATTASNLKTMVMNCMFYGEVSGTSIAPIYNGEIITNVGENTGVSNFNYFRLESSYIENTGKAKVYNCALGAETRFLQRFEFFRHLLNSHRELAAWWASTSITPSPNVTKDDMAKWVLLPSQIGSSTPYPVLKAPNYYPSVVNIDAKNAPLASERNKGGRMGTLSVTIQPGNGEVYKAPTEAHIRIPFKTLIITDKDPEHFNFNYYKVQLPYYNEVGTGNYTGNRVVTGWKIVSITGGTPGTFSTNTADAPSFNFADRNCTNKDLYSTSHRVFNQGAYWDVPEGVTAITIEPYWAKCVYLADPNADKVYTQDMKTGYDVPNVGGGQIYTNGNSYSIAGEDQIVYTSMGNAISSTNSTGLFVGVNANTHTVNDYAVVLVGNYHHYGALEASNSKPYTVTSIDRDGDNEPDYSYILRFDSRTAAHPVKVDFINIPGLGMAQKSTGGTGSYNFGIMQPKGWFESTNTSLFRVTQFEYDRSDRGAAPYIVQGGVMEQWVSGQNNGAGNNTIYFHVGGNAWFKEFHRGTHQDKNLQSKHPPVSVTGGDYDEFYLTGLYTANVTSYGDNAECYINGGRFGVVAGAAMEGLGKANGADNTGNITWQVQNADIKEFFAGGINAAKPVTGNLSTTITGGKIDLFCGGPKFGDMSTGKTVITNATDCIFGTFFGAGYGGNSYSRQAPRNHNNLINFPHNDGQAGNHNSWNDWLDDYYTQSYSDTYGGVSTQFSYQFLPMSGNVDNCARIFVEYVKFSLATCRNVTSTLTGCKITGNFYGGGSLGVVDGPVTSTLTNCEVQGNVFGAGFSASLPSVEVDAIGFETEPFYYKDLGTYRKGVKGSTTTYKWQHGSAISIDTDKKILYTTEELDELGAVTGNATLTINGTTTVGKSVYGGGQESNVEGKTQVNITGGTITQNVFGGGMGVADNFACSKAMVGVNDAGKCADPGSAENKDKGTKVSISNGTVNGNVYGGGEVGRVEWNTQVEIGVGTGDGPFAPEINGSVFGAGKGKETHGYAALVRGNSSVTIQGKAKVRDNVYGGGEQATVGRYWVKGIDTDLCPDEGTKPTAPDGLPDEMPYKTRRGGKCTVIVQGEAQIGPNDGPTEIAGHVFGAGKGVTPAYNNTQGNNNRSKRMVDYNSSKHTGEPGTTWDYYPDDHKYVWEYFATEDKYFEFLQTLALATGTDVTINGSAKVKGSVYGGSESGYVQDDTDVKVKGGTIGTEDLGGAYYGNVYGGGKGDAKHMGVEKKYVAAGLVKGNTKVKIENGTILHNIYGGGAYGSVGEFTYDANGMPTGRKTYTVGETVESTTGGNTEITITGGTIGSDGHENGMVFGSSRGDVAAPGTDGVDPNDRMAWVYSTHVKIGDTNVQSSPTIKGSIYGSGENGHTFQNTIVDVNKGIIGITDTSVDGGATYAYRGNVYGGGCGTDKYDSDNDGTKDKYNPLAGIVQGTTTVNITGGHVVHNVYGAGAMGSVGGGADANSGKTTINISGGRIGYDGNENGHVFGAARGEFGVSDAASNLANVRETEVNINYATTPAADNEGKTEQLIAGSVFGGGEAGTVKGSVAVKMTGGLVLNDVYGGGALADTQTSNWNADANNGAGGWATGMTSASSTTTVRLTGGTIMGEAYGGGLGETGKPAYVYGDVLLDLNGETKSGEEDMTIARDARGCAVDQVFGCNNADGTPMGDVLVHVHATQNKNKSQVANSPATVDTPAVTDAKQKGVYDVSAVYGGGNLAAYEPADPDNNKTEVVIDGCELTSIKQVYGGGNAACAPSTNVTVNGTFEVEELFGGGNGLDNIVVNGVTKPNPGANVGYKNYSEYYEEDDVWKVRDMAAYDTKDERTAPTSAIVYGTGKASVNIYGGTIHRVFGGSNTKGNVRQTALTLLDDNEGCTFCVDEAYGGGKSAEMDAETKLLMACIPGLEAVYGGAEAADVRGNVTLNITNGTFDRVFGGNNLSGTISGSITVNVEEIGCKPVKIGELYGGGNQAGYSKYGYKLDEEGETMIPIEDPNDPEALKDDDIYDDPQVNVMSFTSIGNVYGGGYGEGATMVGNPTVNINEAYGKYYNEDVSVVGENAKTPNNYPIPSHAKGKMGAISNVFGGGNAAKVIGNTTVNIGTLEEVYVVKEVTADTALPAGCYTRNNDGTYSAATGTAEEGKTYYEMKTVQGVDIRGNVYGGGNNAEVTGNTNVNIGKKAE